jgi:molecular chaperone GrpE (heat shock protein)
MPASASAAAAAAALAAGGSVFVCGFRRGESLMRQHDSEIDSLRHELASARSELAAACTQLASPTPTSSSTASLTNSLTQELHDHVVQLEAQEGFGNTYLLYGIVLGLSAFTARGWMSMRLAQREYIGRKDCWRAILRQHKQHQTKMARFGAEALAKDLLPLLDVPASHHAATHARSMTIAERAMGADIKRDGPVGVANLDKPNASLDHGRAISRTAILEALSQQGIEPFEPKVGDAFDASCMLDADDEDKGYQTSDEGNIFINKRSKALDHGYIVAETLHRGYMMHGERVLRRASVRLESAEQSPNHK